LGRPFSFLAAAAAVVVAAVIVIAAVAAAVAEQEDQDDDPPPVIAAKAVADAVIVTTHNHTSEICFELCRSFHGIPKGRKCARSFANYRVRSASTRAVLPAVFSSLILMTRAGQPATTVLGSTSPTTTAPAATTAS